MGYETEFTESSYLRMIKEFTNCGYSLANFNGHLTKETLLVIRHDIDIDLDAAEKMAQLENENQIKSTYFISMRSPFYNPFSASNIRKINKIHILGHDIGVHINVKIENGDHLNDIKIFQSNFPFINTQIATLHHPGSMDAIKNMLHIPVLQSTYAQIFDDTVAYFSDSTGKWRYGHPLDSDVIKKRKSIILLIHPIWWIEQGENPRAKLMNILVKNKGDTTDIEHFLPHFYEDNYK